MNFFATILRRICFYALIALIPLCFTQAGHGGFAEQCDQKKAEAKSAEITLCLSQRFHRKLQPRVLRCRALTRPLVRLDQLDPELNTLRPETFPPLPWASRSLPMLC